MICTSMSDTLKPATPADFAAILALNDAAVKWTSPLDEARLAQLHGWSVYHKVVLVDEVVAGFLLVMPADTDYDSDNYRWFQRHCEDFYYVDRIVIDAAYAGRKLGSLLYQDLFQTAGEQGIKSITCEYNLQPLNQPSAAFHQTFGFQELATQWLDGHSKQVSLQQALVGQLSGGSDAS